MASKKNPYQPDDVKLPKVKNLSELFATATLWPTGEPGRLGSLEPFKMGALTSRGFCQVDVVGSGKHFDALAIRPTALLDSAVGSMLYIEHDQIYFNIIVYKDNTSRVYAKYNQIIGSRLIAEFSAASTREFFRNLKKSVEYPSLPRAVKAG